MITHNDTDDTEIEEKLVRHSFDLMGVADGKGYYVYLNDRWADVLGWSIKELTSRPCLEFVHPDDVTASKEAVARPHLGETVIDFENRQRTKSGDYRWIQWRSTALLDDGRIYFTGRDVTQRRAAEEQLRTLAMTDGLTGLFNRNFFDDRFQREMKRAQRYKRHLSLVMFDLDHFKTINDGYGHGVGDEVLRQVARSAASQLRETDVLARYGGEEFVVLLPELTYGEALAVAEKLRSTIRSSRIPVEEETLKCTASFGVSSMLSDDKDFRNILDRADKGLYEAKAKGRNRVIGRLGKV
jgi:diguanylate cyclase (GGDEF)-like protein/PAS domain S-box-containing protein